MAIRSWNAHAGRVDDGVCALQRTFLKAVRDDFLDLYRDLTAQSLSASRSHRARLSSLASNFSGLKTHNTCLCCLMRKPERVLICDHALCDICIRIFGTKLKKQRNSYLLPSCPLCHTFNSGRIFEFLPRTAGYRGLSLDGGGTRGVIPLTYLKRIQEELGLDCAIQDCFDFVVGTSAGERTQSLYSN